MTSPFWFSGTLRAGRSFTTINATLGSVEIALRQAKVGQVHVDRWRIAFRATGRASWSIGPISSGEIAFSSAEDGIIVRYRYSWFGQFILMIASFTLFAVIGLSSSTVDGLIVFLLLLPMGLFVVGGRYAMIRRLFPRFLARAIGAPWPQPPRRSNVGDRFPEY